MAKKKPRRKKYYCFKCRCSHYEDSDIGKKHNPKRLLSKKVKDIKSK